MYAFLLHNGIDSLYKGYAASLDLLVLAAWNSVAKLKTGGRRAEGALGLGKIRPPLLSYRIVLLMC